MVGDPHKGTERTAGVKATQKHIVAVPQQL